MNTALNVGKSLTVAMIQVACLACLSVLAPLLAQGATSANGKIAFVSADELDGDDEIYTINPDGTGLVQLTHNRVLDRLPAWSPDGSQIAFLSQGLDANFGIYVMSADGTGRRLVTLASPRTISWSPDGGYLAFDLYDPADSDNTTVFVVNVDGGDVRVLTLANYGSFPAWSPDGSRILFIKLDAHGYGALATIRPDGSGLLDLPSGYDIDSWGNWSPTWSPDGLRIAFVINVWDFAEQIWLANADGSGRRPFHGCDSYSSQCPNSVDQPRFSPDGLSMVFSEFNSFTRAPAGIFIKNLDGTGLRTLVRNAHSPSWQPLPDGLPDGAQVPLGNPAAVGLNVLSGAATPYPPGCLALGLPTAPDPADDTAVSRVIDVPGIQSQTADMQAEITLWRVACADEAYSVVLMRMRGVAGNDAHFAMPGVTADIGEVATGRLANRAHLSPWQEDVTLGAGDSSGIPVDHDGVSFVLGVESLPMDPSDRTLFGPHAYNQAFTVELGWDLFGSTSRHLERFTVPAFDPDASGPQFWQPVFNGRHTGSYVVEGIPRTGLLLQIAEAKPVGGLAERNYAFVTLYTYTDDGKQLWLTGNTEPGAPGMLEIEIELYRPEGGLFLTHPPGSFTSNDVTMQSEGRLKLRVADCNTLEVDYDFSEGAGALAGAGTLLFKRLIRVAGYDCNPWEN